MKILRDSARTDEQIRSFLRDADNLLALCNSDYDDTTEYQLLECIDTSVKTRLLGRFSAILRCFALKYTKYSCGKAPCLSKNQPEKSEFPTRVSIIEDSVRRFRKKEDGGFSSSMLQSPTDPDATYREKAEKNIEVMWQM